VSCWGVAISPFPPVNLPVPRSPSYSLLQEAAEDASSSASKAGHGVSGSLDSAGRSIKGAAHNVGDKVSHAAGKVGGWGKTLPVLFAVLFYASAFNIRALLHAQECSHQQQRLAATAGRFGYSQTWLQYSDLPCPRRQITIASYSPACLCPPAPGEGCCGPCC
jgi:hypothetical protein